MGGAVIDSELDKNEYQELYDYISFNPLMGGAVIDRPDDIRVHVHVESLLFQSPDGRGGH